MTMDDSRASFEQQVQKLLDDKAAVVLRAAEFAAEERSLTARLAEVRAGYRESWDEAVRMGWTKNQLVQVGLVAPPKGPRGRPRATGSSRRAPRATRAKSRSATPDNAGTAPAGGAAIGDPSGRLEPTGSPSPGHDLGRTAAASS